MRPTMFIGFPTGDSGLAASGTPGCLCGEVQAEFGGSGPAPNFLVGLAGTSSQTGLNTLFGIHLWKG